MPKDQGECRMSPSQIIGASQAARTLSRQIERVGKGENIFILKNNSVKAVLLSVQEYERLCGLAEIAERSAIYHTVKKRKKVDRNKDKDLKTVLKEHGI